MPEAGPQHRIRPRKWKRAAAAALLLLIGGAVVNVAVAWGCAYWVDPEARLGPVTLPLHAFDAAHWRPEDETKPYAGWSVHRQERTGAMRITSRWSDRDPSVQWYTTGNSEPEAQVPSWGRFLLPPQVRTSTGRQYERQVEAWGFPMLSMYSTRGNDRRFDTAGTLSVDRGIELPPATRSRPIFGTYLAPRALPAIPIWPGFIINTLFYALLLWLLFIAPFAARRMIRRRRGFRGLCEKCAYPIGTSEVCTECGAPVPRRVET